MRETYLAGLDKDDIEQECYLQLQKAIGRYNPHLGVPFESYYKISIYGWRANQNRNKRKSEIALGEEEISYIKDERINIERDVEIQMLAEEVIGKIEELEEKEKIIIKGYYLQHRTLKDIACEMGLAYKAAEAKKRRALLQLREMLG